jgi:hypothetical protein
MHVERQSMHWSAIGAPLERRGWERAVNRAYVWTPTGVVKLVGEGMAHDHTYIRV